jgi:putative RNase toxin 16 of polymorphic toxin system
MPIPRTSRLAPAALIVLACVLGAGDARADRACEADPSTTGRMCSVAQCLALQLTVNTACKSPAPSSCTRLSGCDALKQERSRWLQCYIARTTINSVCWSGGDAGHQQAAAQAIQNVGTCDARIALPEPVGCSNPCR